MSTRVIDHCAPMGGVAFDAPELESIQGNTNNVAFVTLLDIVGGGFVYSIFCSVDINQGELKLTIDGHTETLAVIFPEDIVQFEVYLTNGNYAMVHNFSEIINFKAWFQDEFKVEYRITTANTIYAKIDYGVI